MMCLLDTLAKGVSKDFNRATSASGSGSTAGPPKKETPQMQKSRKAQGLAAFSLK
jgi:hypothetical protein